MSNLIPTPRTDKNGRTVTRHMKPQSGSTALITTILDSNEPALSHGII